MIQNDLPSTIWPQLFMASMCSIAYSINIEKYL
jgi:hypothetical protein